MSIELGKKIMKAFHDINDFGKLDDEFKKFAEKYLAEPFFIKRKVMMDNLLNILESQIKERAE